MTTFESAVIASAPLHAELQDELSSTSRAPAALSKAQQTISILEADINAQAELLDQLSCVREKERLEHERYRDSVVKRFAYRVGGQREKFEARAAKEEQDYLDVLQRIQDTRAKKEALGTHLAKVQESMADLEYTAARHARAQACLDALYDSLFAGPTRSFPDEDAAETLAAASERDYLSARTAWDKESQAAQMLSEASKMLSAALDTVEAALAASDAAPTRLPFALTGTGATYQRVDLSLAQSYLVHMGMLLSQAVRLSPAIRSPGKMEAVSACLLPDVAFRGSFWEDPIMRERMEDAKSELMRGEWALGAELGAARRRVCDREVLMRTAEKVLAGKKGELRSVREKVFESVCADNWKDIAELY